jgi:FixJ family two-component response regulator
MAITSGMDLIEAIHSIRCKVQLPPTFVPAQHLRIIRNWIVMGALPDVVYVIDDDESFLQALLRLLRSLGLLASGFSSPDALKASLPLPDRACLIVDIAMDKHNGLDVVEKLFPHDKEPPIVFVSATQDIDHLNRAERLSKRPCLAKPFGADALVDTMRKAMQLAHYNRASIQA